jgi:hypothetical protein
MPWVFVVARPATETQLSPPFFEYQTPPLAAAA